MITSTRSILDMVPNSRFTPNSCGAIPTGSADRHSPFEDRTIHPLGRRAAQDPQVVRRGARDHPILGNGKCQKGLGAHDSAQASTSVEVPCPDEPVLSTRNHDLAEARIGTTAVSCEGQPSHRASMSPDERLAPGHVDAPQRAIRSGGDDRRLTVPGSADGDTLGHEWIRERQRPMGIAVLDHAIDAGRHAGADGAYNSRDARSPFEGFGDIGGCVRGWFEQGGSRNSMHGAVRTDESQPTQGDIADEVRDARSPSLVPRIPDRIAADVPRVRVISAFDILQLLTRLVGTDLVCGSLAHARTQIPEDTVVSQQR